MRWTAADASQVSKGKPARSAAAGQAGRSGVATAVSGPAMLAILCSLLSSLLEVTVPEPTYAQFKTDALAQGFDEVLERQWAPGTVVDTHSHSFSVSARVVQGEVWLTVGDDTRRLLAGDTFALGRNIPHAERYGDAGATFWVARRNTG